MLRNYLAAALRNLVRNRLYAAINIVGLAVGFAAALLIALFVRDELTYDRWIPDHDRIVMISSSWKFPNFTDRLDMSPYFTAEMLKQEFPEIEAVARLGGSVASVRNGEVEGREQIYFADATFFDVLKLPVYAGDVTEALRTPDTVVITRSMARKYFGKDDARGGVLEFSRKGTFRVAAVLEGLPSNTHLNLSIIAAGNSSMSGLVQMEAHPPAPDVLAPIVYTYARLTSPAAVRALQRSLPGFVQAHREFRRGNATGSLAAVPIADIHLRSPHVFAMKTSGDASRAYSFAVIAALIVMMASVNFVNLTTALSTRRAVEVGVRKVSGAERRHLILQFLGEITASVALAMALAILIASLLLPPFDAFLKRTISFPVRDPSFLIPLTVATFGLGLAAAAYPAFLLSRGVPARILRGSARAHAGMRLRHLLTAVQFAILVALGLVASVIAAQQRFATHEALRFKTDQIVEVATQCDSSFASAVRTVPGVLGAACSRASILQNREGGVPLPPITFEGRTIDPSPLVVDFGFFELFGIKPVAGRFFSPEFGADAVPAGRGANTQTPAIVINEAMVRSLGFKSPGEAVGQSIRWQFPINPVKLDNTVSGISTIVGVAPDFARGSIRDEIPPTIFWVDRGRDQVINLKLDGRRLPETLGAIDALWKQLGAPRPIDRTFLDQAVQNLYLDLMRQAQVLGALAVIAVFVAALGLFGVTAFAAERRTKEIGVRKAMGATRRDILRLLLWEFSKPVLWANLIAWPAAYLIVRRWLESFAYHIDLAPWMFIAASVIALLIALLTVFSHAALLARSQPVTALRYE